MQVKDFIKKIENNEPFKLVRWGDGEWLMYFKTGRPSAEYDYDEEGANNLQKCLDGDFYYGLQETSKRRFNIPERKWIDADIFHHASIEGKLYPLIEVLKKRKLVFIGSSNLRKIGKILPYDKFVEVPPRNCYKSKEWVKKELLRYGEPAVYCFCCAYLANILIYELDIPEATMIDFGSLFDAFTNHPTRGYQNKMTPEIKYKNLCFTPPLQEAMTDQEKISNVLQNTISSLTQ